jgi:hypothetical protein
MTRKTGFEIASRIHFKTLSQGYGSLLNQDKLKAEVLSPPLKKGDNYFPSQVFWSVQYEAEMSFEMPCRVLRGTPGENR